MKAISKQKAGFTLLEIVIALVIISTLFLILSVAVNTTMNFNYNKRNEAVHTTQVKMLQASLEDAVRASSQELTVNAHEDSYYQIVDNVVGNTVFFITFDIDGNAVYISPHDEFLNKKLENLKSFSIEITDGVLSYQIESSVKGVKPINQIITLR